jgi:catechol 2,3-dioxygenase-like lactoylglutathione lyase family enzyme
MADRATPNLPARDFAATSAFYARMGFAEQFRDKGWMILTRGAVVLEFFPFADLDPAESSFGCCLRLDDLAGFYAVCQAAGIEEKRSGWPRLNPPRVESSGLTIAYLVDADGSLLRLVQN